MSNIKLDELSDYDLVSMFLERGVRFIRERSYESSSIDIDYFIQLPIGRELLHRLSSSCPMKKLILENKNE